MTIQEAIKSGKPFRRIGCSTGWFIIPMLDLMIQYEDHVVALCRDDILATDWEVKND